jgi:hypothetical protein
MLRKIQWALRLEVKAFVIQGTMYVIQFSSVTHPSSFMCLMSSKKNMRAGT